jgi:hypothetical protein
VHFAAHMNGVGSFVIGEKSSNLVMSKLDGNALVVVQVNGEVLLANGAAANDSLIAGRTTFFGQWTMGGVSPDWFTLIHDLPTITTLYNTPNNPPRVPFAVDQLGTAKGGSLYVYDVSFCPALGC